MDTQLLRAKREILNISVVVKKGEELIKSFDFFIHHKENAQFKKFIRGRDLIRQISHGRKYIPKRKGREENGLNTQLTWLHSFSMKPAVHSFPILKYVN